MSSVWVLMKTKTKEIVRVYSDESRAKEDLELIKSKDYKIVCYPLFETQKETVYIEKENPYKYYPPSPYPILTWIDQPQKHWLYEITCDQTTAGTKYSYNSEIT